MTRISFDDFILWCEESGYAVEDRIPRIRNAQDILTIRMPGDPQALAELMDELVVFNGDREGWVLRIRNTNVWNERSEEIGLRHIELLADALIQDPGCSGHVYRFEAAESSSAVAFLTIPILYGWDAHLYSRYGNTLVDVSHHGEVNVSLRADARLAKDRLLPWISPLAAS